MKAGDIVAQLQAVLPSVTDLFTDSIAVDSMTFSGGLVTVNTSVDHNLATNRFVNVIDATNPITITSINRSGAIATAVTNADHDLTFGIVDARRKNKTVILTGATEAEFNGTFELLSVANRRTFTFKVADSGPTTATGSPIIENASQLPGFNGRYQITVLTSTSFTYLVTQSLFATASGTPVVKTDARVARVINIEKAVDAYSKKSLNDLWSFVVLGDVIASKSRDTLNDLTDTAKKNTGWKQRIAQPFTIYTFENTKDDIGGAAARDEMEDVTLAYFKSLLGVIFPSNLSYNLQFVVTFVNHGFQDFNDAYYVHQHNFEMAADITFEDTVGYDFDTAFRDISLSVASDIGTGEDPATANVDLDEVPLT